MVSIFDIKDYAKYIIRQEGDNHQDLDLHERFQKIYFSANTLTKKIFNIESYYKKLEKAFPKSKSVKEAKKNLNNTLMGVESKLK